MSFARRIRPQIARDLVRVTVSVGLALAGFGAAALVCRLPRGDRRLDRLAMDPHPAAPAAPVPAARSRAA